MINDDAPVIGHQTRPSPRRQEPDAHGQAALLLAEGILHGLIEADVLTPEQAASIVQTACEVKVEVADATGESDGRLHQSLRLLSGIGKTVRTYRADGG